jgi:uncharacterized protein
VHSIQIRWIAAHRTGYTEKNFGRTVMKRLLCVAGIVLVLSWTCVAQTSAADSPATKEDVERFLQASHSRDLTKKMAVAMSQGMHQMLHQQYLLHKDELPPDYEARMSTKMDEMLQNMPWDEMMQAMAPVYQKHFTKGDIDNLVAFYSSPTGEKMLREMPSVMAEAMQSMTPIMTKYMETVQQKLRKETDLMIAESRKSSGSSTPAPHN